jgi:hypothetical protein
MREIPQMQGSPCLGCPPAAGRRPPAAIMGARRGASSMRALICRQWGGIEQLQIGEAPVPQPER